eukprot:4875459-Prymnesium_polylepis.1
MLVGPFETHVQQWTSIRVPFALLKRGDRIVRYSGGAVDAADGRTPLGYPPLHMHHIHVQREEPHFFETHGDYDMHPEHGYGSTLPDGTCVVHDGQRVSIFAQVNDVRFSGNETAMATSAPRANAMPRHTLPPYEWYLRIEFLLRSAPSRPAAAAAAASFESNSSRSRGTVRATSISPAVRAGQRWRSTPQEAPIALSQVATNTMATDHAAGCAQWDGTTRACATPQRVAPQGEPGWYANSGVHPAERKAAAPTDGPEAAGGELCETASKMVLMYPQDRLSRSDRLNRYDVGGRPRVFFWTMRMPRAGALRPPAWLHSHRARFAGYALVAGAHTLASLTGLPNVCYGSEQPGCTSVRGARALVLRAAGERVLCHDEPSEP